MILVVEDNLGMIMMIVALEVENALEDQVFFL